jgi:hypothetical protein
MIDLEAIKKHRALWEPDDCTSMPTICEHVDALVAEVERLRELLLNAGWPRESETIAELAIRVERNAVVKWLREVAATMDHNDDPAAGEVGDLAICIERGEHREENP